MPHFGEPQKPRRGWGLASDAEQKTENAVLLASAGMSYLEFGHALAVWTSALWRAVTPCFGN